MTEFRHLRWEDLGQLTRRELSGRIEQESADWEAVPTDGMTEQDVLSYIEFMKIAQMVIEPADLVAHVSSLMHGQDDGYMDRKPGNGPPEEA
ncbi:hypothetical protein [Streptomyces sp. 3N207]|uniref:hypothetical protein n=1 Tax=Streptomyces sp. 3N207 TaxID=3457417 RepID=UPI003FD4BEA8